MISGYMLGIFIEGSPCPYLVGPFTNENAVEAEAMALVDAAPMVKCDNPKCSGHPKLDTMGGFRSGSTTILKTSGGDVTATGWAILVAQPSLLHVQLMDLLGDFSFFQKPRKVHKPH